MTLGNAGVRAHRSSAIARLRLGIVEAIAGASSALLSRERLRPDLSRPSHPRSVSQRVDILYVCCDREYYVRESLASLLDEAGDAGAVWIWQNGTHSGVARILDKVMSHPAVRAVMRSPVNVGLRDPVNWVLRDGSCDFFAKIDDDCVVDSDWLRRQVGFLDRNPEVGISGSWHFAREDVSDELAKKRLVSLRSGDSLLANPWVGGSGFLARRSAFSRLPVLSSREWSIPRWQMRICALGWKCGWAWPLVYQDHMDDPMSPRFPYSSDSEFLSSAPISAVARGIETIDEWSAWHRGCAREILEGSMDPWDYLGLLARLRGRVASFFGRRG